MNAETQRKLHNIATIGTVFAVNADEQTMRLQIGDNQTDDLPIPALSAGLVRVWRCPSVGEQFLLISPSGDLANAIPVISLYSDDNPSPSNDPNEIKIRYNEQDFLTINTQNSQLTLHISDITHQANTQITLDTPKVTITGNLTVNGNVQVDGNIHSDGDTVAGSISLKTHTHGGVMGGSSSTGVPL